MERNYNDRSFEKMLISMVGIFLGVIIGLVIGCLIVFNK
jgi:ABC-type nitrate/sulfonate/bicarbonate transport system permease component